MVIYPLRIIPLSPITINAFQVSIQAVRRALDLEGSNGRQQAMHGINSSHTNPDKFKKIRVPLAFQLFSDKVVQGLQLYRSNIEGTCGDISAMLHFFEQVQNLPGLSDRCFE